MLELHVVQQPPSQAVYQRILRPFPTVVVKGVSNIKSWNNLFIECSLMKQTETTLHPLANNLYTYKNQTCENDKKPGILIGGQLVQRSEMGTNPDTLIVVFR